MSTESDNGGIDPQLASRLPFDLVHRIISHIDNSTVEGRRTLAVCARTSHAFLETAENALYRHVVFSAAELMIFLRGLGQSGDNNTRLRTKRRIGVIEYLEITEIPFSVVWEAASRSPGTPLFPRVHRLAIRKPEHYPLIPWERPPRGILVFDEVDICILGNPDRSCLLPYFAARRVTSFTCHSEVMYWEAREVLLQGFPCGSFRIYCNRPPQRGPQSLFGVPTLEEQSRAMGLLPFQIIARHVEGESEWLDHLSRITEWELDNPITPWGDVSPWLKSPEKMVQFKWYHPDDPRCPPCSACGM